MDKETDETVNVDEAYSVSSSYHAESDLLVLEFVKAFQNLDVEKLKLLFDVHIIMYVTNAKGGVDKIEGCQQLINRIQEVDYTKARLKLSVPQIVSIEKEKVMLMVRITAHKNNRDFENFAAFLCYIKNNKITHIWQVEAKPAHSDEFWKS